MVSKLKEIERVINQIDHPRPRYYLKGSTLKELEIELRVIAEKDYILFM
jgi:hypothetical protein